MQLAEYLEATGQSQEAFAERCSEVAGFRVYQRTISRIANGSYPNGLTANAIIKASREEPTEDGQTVTLDDLAPLESDAA